MERDRQAALDTRTEAQRWLDRGDPHCHNEFAALVREYFYPLLMSALLPKADMCSAKGHVRFAPESDRESRHPQRVMSALLLKADMCGATNDVCFGPKADIESFRPLALICSLNG
jgi:hypothetical protein